MATNRTEPGLQYDIIMKHLNPVVKKRLLGKPYVEPLPYYGVGAKAYQVGAIIGYGRPDKINIIYKMCTANPERSDELATLMMDSAENRIKAWREWLDTGVIEMEEAESADHFLYFIVITESVKDGRDPIKLMNGEIGGKIPAFEGQESAYRKGEFLFIEGLAFGASHPQLTRKMVMTDLRDPAVALLELSRILHLIHPGKHPSQLFRKMVDDVLLTELGSYVAKYHPEFIEPLALSDIKPWPLLR